MSTFFIVCFLLGLGLSIASFLSGFDDITAFEKFFGSSHHHGPKVKVFKGHTKVKAGSHLVDKTVHVSPFNLPTMTAFLAWFGGAGLVAQQTTKLPMAVLIAIAVVVGLIGGAMVNRFLSALMRSEKTVRRLQMEGTLAKVTIPIRAEGGTGEIVFSHDGTRQVAGARSDDGRGIEKGKEVVVLRYEKGIAYVSTWDEELSAITPEA